MTGHKSALASLNHGRELQILQRTRHLSAVRCERTRARTCLSFLGESCAKHAMNRA